MQWLERDAAHLPFGIRPHGWKLATAANLVAERRSGVRRRYAARRLTAFDRKRVLDAMDQEFFNRFQERAARLSVDQARALQPLQGRVHLRRAQREVAGHLGDRRAGAGVADQFHQNDYVLSEQSLRHSLF